MELIQSACLLKTNQTHTIATPHYCSLLATGRSVDEELRHCFILSSFQTKLQDLTSTGEKMNRGLLSSFICRSYFCACLFFLYLLLLLLYFPYFLVEWFLICLLGFEAFFSFDLLVECEVLQWSCCLSWIFLEFSSALQAWIAHVWRETRGALTS